MAGSGASIVRTVSGVLRRDEPVERVPVETASVAVVFLLGDHRRDARLLLIRRSERVGDPWSGHIAFPGGRVEEEDESFSDTAMRETKEELGIDLETEGRFLGYLGVFQARTRRIMVIPSVFVSDHISTITIGPEVASYRWIAFQSVLDPTNRTTHTVEREGLIATFPAFAFGDYLVWGVTERILTALADAVSAPRPASR